MRLFFNFLFAFSLLSIISMSISNAQTPTYAPIDFKFVADVEVAWSNRTATARVFGDPTTDGFPCVIVTANRTEIAMPQNYNLARVTVCGQKAVNLPFAQLDPEFQMLARVCGVMKWPVTWTQPLRSQQLAGVPVWTGEAQCQPTPVAACTCTCRYAFDPQEWVGEARQALRAEEVTNCAGRCFPSAFVTVLSMVRVKMAPEMIIGECDTANQGPASQSYNPNGVSWNTNNNQNSDGTEIVYNFGASTSFPALPQDFAAHFKVTLLEYGVNIEFTQIFSSLLRASRTTVLNVNEVQNMEFATSDTYLTHGTSQLVYRIEHNTMRAGVGSDYSVSDKCEKMLFTEDIFASSVHRLLLVPSAAPPVFVGRYTVRGVACSLWSQAVSSTLKVDWYFPTSAAAAGSSSQGQLPRRVVLRGVGRSPFFAHHPFVPTNVALPADDATYCDRSPFFFDPHCSGDEIAKTTNYQHVIDIAELPRFIAQNRSAFATPSSCIGAGVTVVGSSATNSVGVNPAIVFFLGLVCVIVGVGSARMWCPGNTGKKIDDVDQVVAGSQQQQQRQQPEVVVSPSSTTVEPTAAAARD